MRFSPSLLAQVALLPNLIAGYATPKPSNNQTYTTKTFTTTDGYTYTYDFAPPSNASKPTLLLLHGYPTSRHDWEAPIQALTASGFGIVAPDMLGFGDTSKPTEITAYNARTIAGQLVQILDAEALPQVVGVGHDWGAGTLGKMVNWYPGRFAKLVFVTTSYLPGGELFDIDAANKQGLETAGYQPYGYWYFFNSWDAAGIIERHIESFFHLAFMTNDSAWGRDFADLGAARKWLNANRTSEDPSWLPASFKERWIRSFRQPDIVQASLNYYQALMRGVHAKDEATLPQESKFLNVPVLAVGSARDQITPPAAQKRSFDPWVKAGFEQRVLDAGHWVVVERGEELGRMLVEFADRG